ncbi:MAG: sigma-70 family RNA polymerase sigma factor [Acidobacteriota bacterium]|nr:sigma-70 family RNA polymerase sigma factor [Acidobacteriota bacterium]MDH3785730.1 sigma-70 family RNA polymerase sigma factor [Acidobacteriota bacterium]
MKNQQLDDPIELSAEKIPSDVDLTALYLREVGSTALLTRDDEYRLASALQAAREAYAKAVLQLPTAIANPILAEYEVSRDAQGLWTMRQIEGTCDRLRAVGRASKALREHRAYKPFIRAKREMDTHRDAMIQANLRLVAHVAKKFSKQGLPYMDLVQEGNMGLMKAVEKFEHERGYKFSTYAFWWIKQAITRAISDKSRTIRIPVHLLEKMRKVQRVSRELEEELGRRPKLSEIADRSNVPVKALVEMLGPSHDEVED